MYFNHTQAYADFMKAEGGRAFWLTDLHDTLIVKKPIRLKGAKVPFFYRLEAQNINPTHQNTRALRILARSPLCIACDFDIDPLSPTPAPTFFNQTKYTYLLNLQTHTEESAFALLDSKLRNRIRKVEKNGVEVREVRDRGEFMQYALLREGMRSSSGLAAISSRFYENVWGLLSQKRVRCFVATLRGEEVAAGQLVLPGGGRFTLAGVTVSEKGRLLNANDLLQWRIIQTAIREQMATIDWVGAQPESRDPKMQAIDRFKAKWGGALVAFASYKKRLF